MPALGLSHHVRIIPAEPTALVDAPPADVVLLDARRDLAVARSLCRVLRATGMSIPLIAILTEGGLAGITAEWSVDEVLLESAGPAEVEARLRLAAGRLQAEQEPDEVQITSGDVTIDEATYSARVRGRLLDLTYKEFELEVPARHRAACSAAPSWLQEVWGYDYYGGTRTVDVHVRRLRAKLGLEHEVLIGTGANVGYRFVPSEDQSADA